MTDLTISIVNYNIKDKLEKCLESLYKETKDIGFEVIVVDNASNDGSIEMLKQKFPSVKLIENKVNLFFSKAHNQAFKVSGGKYFLLLNPDTIISGNAFKMMMDFMDSNPMSGACGPKLVDQEMKHEWSGEKFPSLLYGLFELTLLNAVFPNNFIKRNKLQPAWDRSDTREVDTIGGSCLLVRRDIIEKIGLLDENFVLYWEEIDWCKRIKENGYKIFFVSSAVIIHLWGASTNLLKRSEKDKYYIQSLLYYYRKHFGFSVFIAFGILNIFRNMILALKRRLFLWA